MFTGNLRYADDTDLLAIDISKLQHLINTVNEKRKEYGKNMNMNKTKMMVVGKEEVVSNAKISIEWRVTGQVEKFIYLSHFITDNSKCDSEITE